MLQDRPATARIRVVAALPGLALCVLIGVVATGLGRLVPVVGSPLPALVIGLVVAVLRRPGRRFEPGIRVASKTILQCAVVLLGARLSLAEVASAGWASLPIMLTTLTACLVTALVVGRWLRVEGDLRTLIGVGTGICGASAIAAVAPVIGAAGADIAYAVTTIFAFNVAAVVTFPFVGHLIGLDQHAFGLFAGTAVNDTSSVVAVAAIYGSSALAFAVVVKLVRTLMIIPISLGLAFLTARRARTTAGNETTPPALTAGGLLRLVPWFLVGFLCLAGLHSLGLISGRVADGFGVASTLLIAVAMAAIGLSTDVRALRRTGPRPLFLGGILWIVVSLTALTTITLTS